MNKTFFKFSTVALIYAMYSTTHTHTHTQTHMRVHTHTHTHSHMYALMHTHTCTGITYDTHTHTHSHMHTLTHTHTRALALCMTPTVWLALWKWKLLCFLSIIIHWDVITFPQSVCDLPQLHLLSVRMEANLHRGCPPNCQDFLTWLPTPLAAKIMTYLDPGGLTVSLHSHAPYFSWCHLQGLHGLWKFGGNGMSFSRPSKSLKTEWGL